MKKLISIILVISAIIVLNPQWMRAVAQAVQNIPERLENQSEHSQDFFNNVKRNLQKSQRIHDTYIDGLETE